MKPATFILLADPQVGWNGLPATDNSIVNYALNRIHSVEYRNDSAGGIDITCSGPVGKPDAVFFAGDLTNYGGNLNPWDVFFTNPEKQSQATFTGGNLLQIFRELYEPSWAGSSYTPLTECGPLYFGLGNHDISFNNTMDLAWYAPMYVWPTFEGHRITDYFDYYRYQMWNFIAQMHTGYHRILNQYVYFNTTPPFPIPPDYIDADPDGTYEYQKNSYNYVIDLGPVDIYQLHFFGGDLAHQRRSGLDWLKHKLAARGYARPVFIVQHVSLVAPDPEYWNKQGRDQLLEILRPYNVLGVGVGHNHTPRAATEIMPGSTIDGVCNEQHIFEFRPGAAVDRCFGVVRIEESPAGDEIIMNVLYGEVDPNSKEIGWTTGWNRRYPKRELYIKDIEVIYLDHPADDSSHELPWYVTEEGGKSANINEGLGGTFVYIKPILTNNVSEAATGFDLLVQDGVYSGPHTNVRDLADRTNGKHRYLVPKRECGQPLMKQLFLWRADDSQAPRIGWSLSPNINEGRGEPLYLEWEATPHE